MVRCARILLPLAAASLLASLALAEVKQDYTVGPGDMLNIQVYGEKDLTAQYRVGPGGDINLPDVGTVNVTGLTLPQLKQHLADTLSKIIRTPQVMVSIDELDSDRKVYVGGQVTKPGPIMMPFGSTVLDAIIGAGLEPGSDLRKVTLTRPGQPPKTLDLSGWRTSKGLALGELVRYGDIIFVPEVTQRIAVLGAVQKPVSITPVIGERITLLEALAQSAGGVTDQADLSRVTVLRQGSKPIPVDLGKLLYQGDMSQNVVLQPGDVIVVPEAKRISVVGQVETPVTFTSSRPVPVLNALAQAGQVQPDADLAHAKIVGPKGTREVDLEALIEKGKQAGDIELQPGDVLVVPQAPPEEVLLAGAVRTPGPVSIRKMKQHDLLRIVTTAGIIEGGDPTRVCVLRGNKEFVVDYKHMLDTGDLSADTDLQPGDVVYVPSLKKVYVLGAVGSGGAAVPCPDSGMKVLDAIVAAGGLSPIADPNQIHIVRPRPDGTTEHIQLKMGDLRQGHIPAMVMLKPGDIVYVAAKGHGFNWNTARDMLWTAASLFAIF